MPARPSIPALVALVALLGACAPAPEDLCGHLLALSKVELGEAVAETTPEELAKLEARCVDNATRDKAADRKGYKRRATCVLAAEDLAAVDECTRRKADG